MEGLKSSREKCRIYDRLSNIFLLYTLFMSCDFPMLWQHEFFCFWSKYSMSSDLKSTCWLDLFPQSLSLHYWQIWKTKNTLHKIKLSPSCNGHHFIWADLPPTSFQTNRLTEPSSLSYLFKAQLTQHSLNINNLGHINSSVVLESFLFSFDVISLVAIYTSSHIDILCLWLFKIESKYLIDYFI